MLERIVAATKERVAELRARRAAVMERAEAVSQPPSFLDALTTGGGGKALGVIAEIKRRSPSRGDLAPALDVASQARLYTQGGAAALSVLTEPVFFNGHVDDLVAAREATTLPILRKDFVVESLQVWEARALGASAVLLIVAALSPTELQVLLNDTDNAGLSALVEVHDPEEARIAIDSGGRIIAVNNRDLTTFEVDLTVAEKLAPLLSEAAVTVAESGIWTRADAARMAAAGYDAILVGEALVTAPDPVALLRELRG
jgi:indole-3-glycerol phosphate synthase